MYVEVIHNAIPPKNKSELIHLVSKTTAMAFLCQTKILINAI